MRSIFKNNKQRYFERIYKEHAKALFLLVLRYVSSEFDAEEVIQRGFIKVYSNLDSFQEQPGKTIKPWLNKIMVNEALLFLREQNRLKLKEQYEEYDLITDFQDEHIATEECLSLVRQLPDGYRAIFNLYVIEGYAHKEIAEMLHITESTSRSQLVRARKILQSKIKQYETNINFHYPKIHSGG
ncbi:RNA polymerase sigma factor [Puteibacter caeruleilacunae]|nr:RNA polymerase sigma factor [Puteibacter caeruleilacunae]